MVIISLKYIMVCGWVLPEWVDKRPSMKLWAVHKADQIIVIGEIPVEAMFNRAENND